MIYIHIWWRRIERKCLLLCLWQWVKLHSKGGYAKCKARGVISLLVKESIIAKVRLLGAQSNRTTEQKGDKLLCWSCRNWVGKLLCASTWKSLHTSRHNKNSWTDSKSKSGTTWHSKPYVNLAHHTLTHRPTHTHLHIVTWQGVNFLKPRFHNARKKVKISFKCQIKGFFNIYTHTMTICFNGEDQKSNEHRKLWDNF